VGNVVFIESNLKSPTLIMVSPRKQ
jgi:hypothetical protein